MHWRGNSSSREMQPPLDGGDQFLGAHPWEGMAHACGATTSTLQATTEVETLMALSSVDASRRPELPLRSLGWVNVSVGGVIDIPLPVWAEGIGSAGLDAPPVVDTVTSCELGMVRTKVRDQPWITQPRRTKTGEPCTSARQPPPKQ